MSSKTMPTILVIFGATGDLTKRKLAPALLHLSKKNVLPSKFVVVGFGRRPFTDVVFRAHLADMLHEHDPAAANVGSEFLKQFVYVEGDLTTKEGYEVLQKKLEEIDQSWKVCANKLFYLAVPPEKYETIFKHLSSSGLTKPCSEEEGWTRVIVEKPFGHDAATARKLDILLASLFKEQQIYRIDHYLAKEMLQNIIAFRFSNNLLEHGWGNNTIERINIRLWEKIGVESRGAFYEGVGALRDVGQNHLLQMLALIAMERPATFGPDPIRAKRSELLEKLEIPSAKEIIETTHRAQYEGYRDIEGVAKNSMIETYFSVEASLAAAGWEGIPIHMESGKRMGEARKEIVVHLRHDEPCLCPAGIHYRNKIVFGLEPEERITFHFWAKKPGLHAEMEERTIEFLLRDPAAKKQYVEEYEKLLLDCITGDQTLFVNTDEVRAMWRFIDPITKVWEENRVPLESYPPDSVPKFKESPKKEKTIKKEIGYIGLGKMGKNMVIRLHERGWNVSAFDVNPAALGDTQGLEHAQVESVEELVSKLSKPRLIWLMVPAGKPGAELLFGKKGLASLLSSGDTIVDGGNSFFEDSIKRAKILKKKGINYLDIGVSGGPRGARNGATLMIGGEESIARKYEYLFKDLSVPEGFLYVGAAGAGHFTKMVHNGIEYGMMQSIAEGFAVLKKSKFKLSLTKIADLYNHGSVIESRLIGWLRDGFHMSGEDLKEISGIVGHTGEGEWTVNTAKKLGVPVEILKKSFQFRVQSAKKPSYTGKVLSMLRNQFGGHAASIKKKK